MDVTGQIWAGSHRAAERVVLAFLCAYAATLAAAPTTISYRGQPAELMVRSSGPHSVRVSLVPAEQAQVVGDWMRHPALADREWPLPTLRLGTVADQGETSVGSFRVTIKANPLTVRVADGQGRLIQELAIGEPSGNVSFACGNAPVLGLGEGAKQFDRRGAFYPMKSSSGAWDLRHLGSVNAVPLLIGTRGWALWVVSPWGQFDLREERGVFLPEVKVGPALFDAIVIDAHRPENLMQEIIQLTGQPALPPKWALGYLQSHRTLENSKQLVEIADTFRQKQLPCDGLIYLGTGFCPAGWNLAHDSFEFNPQVFDRDPAAVLRDLHARNLHIILHVVPKLRDLHGSIPPALGEVLNDEHIATYWKRHEAIFAQGVDAWWPDEGDWLAVPARIARHRLYYEGPLSARPNRRPWSLHRNGYLGIARYGGWVWSGDVESRWSTLAAQVSVGINHSLSLSPFWGTDAGGFVPTRELTGELYVRWFQFATFCPSFRAHGRTWQLRLPWGWNTGRTGPVEARERPEPTELHNAAVEPICRDYLNLRYRLLAYNYTLAREAHDRGLPLMRALWLHYPDDPQAAGNGSEYLWGPNLLVAPVVEPGATVREVYVPKGDWYDWWTTNKFGGGQALRRPVDLATLPLFVRAGAIIPLDPPRQYVDQPSSEPMTVRIYRGADGRFVLYEDDGESLDYLGGAGNWTAFTWHDRVHRLEIKPDPRSRSAPEKPRVFEVVVLPDGARQRVSFSGRAVQVSLAPSGVVAKP